MRLSKPANGVYEIEVYGLAVVSQRIKVSADSARAGVLAATAQACKLEKNWDLVGICREPIAVEAKRILTKSEQSNGIRRVGDEEGF